MSSEQILTLGLTGQSIYIDTPDGRPSAATVSIYDGRYREDDGDMPIVSAASATAPALNTTVATTAAGASASNTRLLTLSSATGASAGGWAVVANASGQSELVELASVASASALVRQAMVFDYPITTSTVKGIRTTYSISASLFGSTEWLGDEGNLGGPFQVKWTLTGLTPAVRWTSFRLVRRAYVPIVAPLDLAAYWPDSADSEWAAQIGQRYQPQIDKAHEIVRGDLLRKRIVLDTVRDQQLTKTLIELQTMLLIAVGGNAPAGRSAQDQIDIFRPWYRDALTGFGDGSGVPVDTNDDGAISDEERSVRLQRFVRA